MNVMIVDPVQQKERLARATDSLNELAVESAQVRLDKFLDRILSIKGHMTNATEIARRLEEQLHSLFELSDLAEEQLLQVKDLVDTLEKESAVMRTNYIAAGRFFDQYKLSRAPVREYGEMANNLKEVTVDLRHRFFELPLDQEFVDLMHQLGEVA